MKFKAWIAAAALLGICLQGLAAEGDKDYPAKAVKILVQYPPGGAPDLVARVLGAKLSESLGQQFIVENRPGAGGNIATDLVAKAEPDGYTLLLSADPPITINPSLYAKLPFDPVKDLAPVTLATSVAMFLLATPSFPPNSVQELIALARANPEKFNFASSGTGSMHHLAGELLNTLAGIRLVHVPYKGFGAGVADAVGGKVELIFGGVSSAVGFVKSGKLKALAVTSSKRYPGLPQVPTLMESGFPGFEIYAWFGLMAPARTPRPIIDKLHGEVVKALRSKEISERFAALGMDIIAAGPQEFAEKIASDTRMWARIVKESGAKVD
ncbi:MAG: tripartite tricarboxylate transporter substrate binding protein [Betaproteobacteria bacterium]|nr:tripartite tricarboxylate transporter substrate binding protein [Betaproteobacteria bacterium]